MHLQFGSLAVSRQTLHDMSHFEKRVAPTLHLLMKHKFFPINFCLLAMTIRVCTRTYAGT